MRLLRLIPLLLCLALPAPAQEASGTITTENTAQLDADIAIRIREILGALDNYEDVTVTVNEGVVTLRGTATSATDALALDPLAARVQGVVAVRNQVTETTDIGKRLDPAIDRFRARVDQFIVFLPLALIAAIAFAIVVLIGFGMLLQYLSTYLVVTRVLRNRVKHLK